MPTAIPAASPRPGTGPAGMRRRAPAFGRPFTFVLALAFAFVGLAAGPINVSAYGSSACAGWHSLTEPPTHIRVLRRRSNDIVSVPFRRYVIIVMGKEWPTYLPQAVVEAGAVVVKQYAWYHAVYSSRASNGRCYDVRDGVTDQLYKPGRARIGAEHHRAVDRTWGVTLYKNGRFLMTGYRRGEKGRCGRDATGFKLYARSAIACARHGRDWREILRTYYGPGLTLTGDADAASREATAPAATAQPPEAPPETSVTPLANGDPAINTTGAVGAIGGATTGGCGAAVSLHEQTMLSRLGAGPGD